MNAEELRDREYRYALTALRNTHRAVALWVDSVSAVVEQRLGVSSSDPSRFKDPDYAAALDIARLVEDALAKMEANHAD